MNSQRRVTASVAAVLALLLGTVLIFWLLGGDHPEVAVPTAETDSRASERLETSPRSSSAAASPSVNEVDDTPVPEISEADEEPPAEDEARVTLRMVDSASEPTPLVSFEYAMLSGTELIESKGDVPTQSGRLDSSGRWRVVVPVDRLLDRLLMVRLPGNDWRCVRPGLTEKGGIPNNVLPKDDNAVVLPLTRDTEQSYTVKLLRVNQCALVVEYEDGRPFEGKVNLSWFTTNDGHRELAWRSRPDYEPSMRIPVIESTQLGVGGESARPGFKARFGAAPTPAELRGGLLHIVIAADDDRVDPCGLILVHTGFSPGQVMDAFLVTNRGIGTGGRVRLKGPGETRTAHISPRPISCMAIGDGMVWSSGLQNLEPGEWRRVTVDPQPLARLSVTVKNEEGEPLGGAVVSTIEVGSADWYALSVGNELTPGGNKPRLDARMSDTDLTISRIQLARSRTDSRGQVLIRTWAGKRSFRVDARGYQSRVIECTLRPGELYDYGDVTLEKPNTEVTVRIITAENEEPSGFAVCFWGLSEGAAKSDMIPFDDGDTKLVENVPTGRYQVYVKRYKGGGPLWWRHIELERGDREEVVIDLTRDSGLQDD